MSVRTRFAPSPTGFMHVGGVRTALFAWLYARKMGGQFLLRIEDTDKEREVEGAIGHIMESLRWLGIEWDEGPDVDGPYGPYIQSARLPLYQDYARRLLEAGFAYPDPFTEEEIDELRKSAESEGRPFLYREHRPEQAGEWDGETTLRFKVPRVVRYTWQDAVLGELSAGEEALDDFVLIKNDGYPTYNFAHVVDDIEMGITHVMRGNEFVSSTPKFLSLYEALDMPPPIFVTLPPILGEAGTKKLSKRDGAKDILDYRTEGYLPHAMVNFLSLLGWHPEEGSEVLSLEDITAAFDITDIGKSGARFDEDKLLHINREWMRTLSEETYIEKLGETSASRELLPMLVPLLKERAATFSEARDMLATELSFFFNAPTLDKELLVSKEPSKDASATAEHLRALQALIDSLPELADVETIKSHLMPYADSISKEHGGRGAVLWPLRYALTGQERSPDPFTLIHILPRKEVISRIEGALAIL